MDLDRASNEVSSACTALSIMAALDELHPGPTMSEASLKLFQAVEKMDPALEEFFKMYKATCKQVTCDY